MACTTKLLPVPGGPMNSTSRCSRTKRQVARSKTCFVGIDGIEGPIEVVQRLQFTELAPLSRGGRSAADCAPAVHPARCSSRNSAWLSWWPAASCSRTSKVSASPERRSWRKRTLQTIIHGVSPGGTRKGELRWNGPVKRSQALLRSTLARDNRTDGRVNERSDEPWRRRCRSCARLSCGNRHRPSHAS